MSTRAVYMLLQYEHPQKPARLGTISTTDSNGIAGLRRTARLGRAHRGVSDQACSWSVQNNIAEGNARRGRADRHRLFNVALSSLAEVDSMLATIPVLYSVDQSVLDSVEVLRRQITAGVLAMIKRGRK